MFIAIALLLSATSAATPSSSTYRPYTNGRFAYQTCAPVDFKVISSADNQDGKTWVNNDGVRLSSWGYYNLDGETAVSQMRYYLTPRDKVSYAVAKRNWAVVSGISGNMVFWRKLVKQGDRIIGVEMRYPVQLKDRYDAVTSVVASCSRPL